MHCLHRTRANSPIRQILSQDTNMCAVQAGDSAGKLPVKRPWLGESSA